MMQEKVMSKVKVFYRGTAGVMTFMGRRPVFQHRNSEEKLDIGLGVIDENTIVDKGRYMFAHMRNVRSVLPAFKLETFKERGSVPQKIYKGTYGNNILLKEQGLVQTFITAYDEEGNQLLRHKKFIKEGEINTNYSRIDKLVEDWEDITDQVVFQLVDDILNKKAQINLANAYLLYILKRVYKNGVYRLANGVIVADGNYESLIVWNDGDMVWFGRKFDKSRSENVEDITKQVESLIKDMGIQ